LALLLSELTTETMFVDRYGLMKSSPIDTACCFQIGSKQAVSVAQRFDHGFQIVAGAHIPMIQKRCLRFRCLLGDPTPSGGRHLSRDLSFLALRLTLLCRFFWNARLINRDARECAEGGAQNFSLGCKQMLLGVPIMAPAFDQKAIGTFTDSLFQILHCQVSCPDPRSSLTKHS